MIVLVHVHSCTNEYNKSIILNKITTGFCQNKNFDCKHVAYMYKSRANYVTDLPLYRSRTIIVDLRHRFTVIHMNEMNVFDQQEQSCHLYL